jgi:hypothetical protein
MRRLAVALRQLMVGILRAIDVEGFLLLAGIAGLGYVLWTVDWRLAVGALSVLFIVAGIALARAPRAAS